MLNHLQNMTPRLHGEASTLLTVAEMEPGDKSSTTWPPPPARRPPPQTEQTARSTDPRPPLVARATAGPRRTPSQEGRRADTNHRTSSITASTTPPVGHLDLLYTRHRHRSRLPPLSRRRSSRRRRRETAVWLPADRGNLDASFSPLSYCSTGKVGEEESEP